MFCRQPLQAVDDLVGRTLRTGFAGFHVADRRLLQPNRLPDLRLGEPGLAEAFDSERDVHERYYGNSGI